MIKDHWNLFSTQEKNYRKLQRASRILRWAIRLMAFDFDIEYVKGHTIPHVDALSRLRFYREDKDKNDEEFEDTFLHLIETDIISVDKMATETTNDPVLNRIVLRIKENRWGNCSMAERPFKEIRYKLTIENGVICNGSSPRNTKGTGYKKCT